MPRIPELSVEAQLANLYGKVWAIDTNSPLRPELIPGFHGLLTLGVTAYSVINHGNDYANYYGQAQVWGSNLALLFTGSALSAKLRGFQKLREEGYVRNIAFLEGRPTETAEQLNLEVARARRVVHLAHYNLPGILEVWGFDLYYLLSHNLWNKNKDINPYKDMADRDLKFFVETGMLSWDQPRVAEEITRDALIVKRRAFEDAARNPLRSPRQRVWGNYAMGRIDQILKQLPSIS